ncbi:hypothetical protein B0H16DRAFT_948196 [Mycena metata]|uniref:Methyltransferase domain-containing protein n=1 Tax=Mycena metata TaxID=1033252 RepID=A0AAD7K2Q3_9AGAR|nr:hypothetical protein B0H16DRAFT_948196 [Mycena metata]
MSSRAASGRKRLRPSEAAPPSPSIDPQSANTFSDPNTGRRAYYSPAQGLGTLASPRSTTPPSSRSSRQSPPSQSSPDFMQSLTVGHGRPPAGLTPYPNSTEFQPQSSRKEKSLPFRATNPNPLSPNTLSPTPSHAPPYRSRSVQFLETENANSRRVSPGSRALPPYPSQPPVGVNTGWSALSDVKVASAMAVPPRYRSGSVASSSRLPPASAPFEPTDIDTYPPHYSPSASPRLLPTRLRLGSAPGAFSPPQQATNLQPPDAAYPSSFSSPTTSLSSLAREFQTYHESSMSSSSDSISESSLASLRAYPNPARQSVSTFSSGSVDADPPAPIPPPPAPPPPASPAFVFPSSRSRARPNGATQPVGFKFRGRRKLKAQLANVQVLAPGTPIPAEGVFTAQSPKAPNRTHGPGPSAPPQNLHLRKTTSAGSGSSGGSNGEAPRVAPPAAPASADPNAPPTFYFPSSRTRAHPKAPPPQFSLGKGKKKEGTGTGTGTKGFLRLALNRKKVVPLPGPVDVPAVERPPSERSVPLLPEGGDELSLEFQTSFEDLRPDTPPPPIATKIGSYPLDSYDATLIENDRQTWELLRKINSTNTPSFHNYGGRPPHNVLDLGCGAGHWMLDAAMTWRNSGTQIIGFDMVDTTKGLWPTVQRQGLTENLKFVRGNFVKQPLPFPDGSFQLVRMANVALCIPHEQWEFVLDQVWRVLAVGGRLEFIDDHIFFPYGKPPVLHPSGSPASSTPSPHLDMMIPSTVFSRMSLDAVIGSNVREDADSEIYNLYGVEEQDEYEGSDADTIANSDADTIAFGRSGRQLETPTPQGYSTRSSSARSSLSGSGSGSRSGSILGTFISHEAWHEQASAARELEALFEHMLNTKFGIHLRPSEFVFEMLMRVFGGVKEMTSMHITLAPPEQSFDENGQPYQRPPSVAGRAQSARFAQQQGPGPDTAPEDALGHCPGLILWPSTFIPMPLSELETHASKHLRVLLSCKAALIDYAAEIADVGEGTTQSEAAMEALWEYQNFLRERFNPPPEDPRRSSSSLDDDNESIFSISSVGTEAFDAMREYQSELRGHFDLTSMRNTPTPTPNSSSPSPSASNSSNSNSRSRSANAQPPPAPSLTPPPTRVRKRGSRSRTRDRTSMVSNMSVVPPYSRIELTHVRSFYVFEAVKQAPGRFAPGRGRS